jgi:hypothetical protein
VSGVYRTWLVRSFRGPAASRGLTLNSFVDSLGISRVQSHLGPGPQHRAVADLPPPAMSNAWSARPRLPSAFEATRMAMTMVSYGLLGCRSFCDLPRALRSRCRRRN